MPFKVIAFPRAAHAAAILPSLAVRQQFVVTVGIRQYSVDVRASIRLLPCDAPAGAQNIRVCVTESGADTPTRTSARGSEVAPAAMRIIKAGLEERGFVKARERWRQWNEHRRKLGIGGRSPRKRKSRKQLLAFARKESDESTCAEHAQKETEMSNVEESSMVGGPAGAVAGAEKRAKTGRGRKTGATKGQRSASRAKRQAGSKTSIKGGKRAVQTGSEGKAKGPRAESKGAQILELIGGAKGASLAEIQTATGWQAHSVRGFLSTAAKKLGLKIESRRSEAGERVYQAKTQR